MLNYSWKASPNRWGRSKFNASFSVGFWNGLTMYIHCIYTFIRCIYMYIRCTWVLLIICIYHFHVCQSVQPCKMYVLCYRTLIWLSVCTEFRMNSDRYFTPLVYTPLEVSGQVGRFHVAFSPFCVLTLLCTVYQCTKHRHTRFRRVFEEKLQESYPPALTLLRRYIPVWIQSELSTYRKSNSCTIAWYIHLTWAVQASMKLYSSGSTDSTECFSMFLLWTTMRHAQTCISYVQPSLCHVCIMYKHVYTIMNACISFIQCSIRVYTRIYRYVYVWSCAYMFRPCIYLVHTWHVQFHFAMDKKYKKKKYCKELGMNPQSCA